MNPVTRRRRSKWCVLLVPRGRVKLRRERECRRSGVADSKARGGAVRSPVGDSSGCEAIRRGCRTAAASRAGPRDAHRRSHEPVSVVAAVVAVLDSPEGVTRRRQTSAGRRSMRCASKIAGGPPFRDETRLGVGNRDDREVGPADRWHRVRSRHVHRSPSGSVTMTASAGEVDTPSAPSGARRNRRSGARFKLRRAAHPGEALPRMAPLSGCRTSLPRTGRRLVEAPARQHGGGGRRLSRRGISSACGPHSTRAPLRCREDPSGRRRASALERSSWTLARPDRPGRRRDRRPAPVEVERQGPRRSRRVCQACVTGLVPTRGSSGRRARAAGAFSKSASQHSSRRGCEEQYVHVDTSLWCRPLRHQGDAVTSTRHDRPARGG